MNDAAVRERRGNTRLATEIVPVGPAPKTDVRGAPPGLGKILLSTPPETVRQILARARAHPWVSGEVSELLRAATNSGDFETGLSVLDRILSERQNRFDAGFFGRLRIFAVLHETVGWAEIDTFVSGRPRLLARMKPGSTDPVRFPGFIEAIARAMSEAKEDIVA